MPLYNMYAPQGAGGRLTRVYSFTASCTSAAEAFALERLTESPVELWCGSKKVARFDGKPTGKPIQSGSHE
jgi:hypothetical protein